ncbi:MULTISPECIES: hypothetical protein [Bacillaceae]|uniref:Uncharacterized protein n=1 Tax=Evansella alkalicola TaxID=745819 RepID=A0ABS6JZC3_9BACI|nr:MULTISPECIES: hypothetical protein [Bacillaceae]MBU9723760.1 hypothetical protein [Bacillus alkalicola]
MKVFAIILIALSTISFRACDHQQPHEDLELSLSPNYSEGVLYLTPVITYIGEDPIKLHYGNNIAWIERVEKDEETYFEYEEPTAVLEHRSKLVEEDERAGQTIKIEVDPGTYEIVLKAEYTVEKDGERATNTDGNNGFQHTNRVVQTIEVKR